MGRPGAALLTLEQVSESPRSLIKTTDGRAPAPVFLIQKVWDGACNKFLGDADADDAGPGLHFDKQQPSAFRRKIHT